MSVGIAEEKENSFFGCNTLHIPPSPKSKSSRLIFPANFRRLKNEIPLGRPPSHPHPEWSNNMDYLLFAISATFSTFHQKYFLLRQISASSIFWQDGDGDHSPARGDGLLQLPGVQPGNPDCKFSLSPSSLINHRAPLILKAKSSIATDQQNLCLQQCNPLINLTSTLELLPFFFTY